MSRSLPELEGSFDFVVIGSGFGGSVSAMRLAQKGYRVAVLEVGKRWQPADFPRTNWNAFKYLWAPRLRCFGIQRITLLKGVMVLHGSGVGGGSLVYANTLMRPADEVFDDPSWGTAVAWKSAAPVCTNEYPAASVTVMVTFAPAWTTETVPNGAVPQPPVQ